MLDRNMKSLMGCRYLRWTLASDWKGLWNQSIDNTVVAFQFLFHLILTELGFC